MAIHEGNMLFHDGATIGRDARVIAMDGTVAALNIGVKRCLDVALTIVALILLAPLLLVIALLIKLDSAGPAVFVQERVGARRRTKDGRMVWEIRNFSVYKFRSMVHNADESVHQAYIKAWIDGQAAAAHQGVTFKLTKDPRVTRVGRILRKTSLDELPQLFNVLKGDMSLVGPRPVPTYEVAEYQDWHRERLAALPGITGLWQVKGRCQVSFEEMIRMDIDYVRSRSLWLDVKLLFLTIPAVLSGRGAE
ncbi:MAG: sugar transferase [Chloroflexota bacterium]|nr:sugar transferase [Chloroflexota bacterium]